MYDDLSRIEAVYGSVAEYNRVRSEEHQECSEPDESHSLDYAIYREKIRVLCGIPSENAKHIKEQFEATRPKREDFPADTNYYAAIRKHSAMCHELAVQTIENQYNVKFTKDSLFDVEPSTFSIGVEYVDFSRVYHLNIRNILYSKFTDIFRDLRYLGLRPTVCYCSDQGKKTTLSNCSLGDLLMYDFTRLGIISQRYVDSMLMRYGFDENEFRKNYKGGQLSGCSN